MQETGRDTFETSISRWSLKFNGADFEDQYREERLELKRAPKQLKVFFCIGICAAGLLVLFDAISAFSGEGSYSYQWYDIAALVFYIPVGIVEALCYKCKKLSFLRGTFFTVVLYLTLFYSTVSVYADKTDYPLISPE